MGIWAEERRGAVSETAKGAAAIFVAFVTGLR